MLKSILLPIFSFLWAGEMLLPAGISSTVTEAPVPMIEDHFVSWGYNGFVTRNSAAINTVVVHSCYNPTGERYSVDQTLKILRKDRVATHYLIDRQGKTYRLVPEYRVAYHAGASRMPDGRTHVNRFSVGVELLGHPSDTFTEAQYEALDQLLRDIKTRLPIRHIKGHGEIAPLRKNDPWNIQWSRVRTTQFATLP